MNQISAWPRFSVVHNEHACNIAHVFIGGKSQMPAGSAYSDDIDGREALCRDVILSAGALALEGFQHGSAAAFQ
jgi:hypothetical protein